MQLWNKTPKRRVKVKLREDRRPPSKANETWAMEFIHDQLATGRKIRVLTVVDTFSRYAPVIDPRFSYRADDVVATLEKACAALGYLQTVWVDQGSEFVSHDLDLWTPHHGRQAARPYQQRLTASRYGRGSGALTSIFTGPRFGNCARVISTR